MKTTKPTKPTKVKTVWQVRWPGLRWRQSFKTRQEAREYAKWDWLTAMRGRPIIVKITEQVVA